VAGGLENAGCPLKQLRFPLRDLIGMNIKSLSNFDQGLVAFDRGDGNLRFEGRRVVPARSSCHDSSYLKGFSPSVEQSHHLAGCPIIRGHFSDQDDGG
jgi:hypothetical protein